jgi:hypothetical protein
MCQADGRLQQLQLLLQAQGEAAGQALVVQVFGLQAGGPFKAALRVQHLGEVDPPHLPGPALRLHHIGQGLGGCAVATAGVEPHQVDDGLVRQWHAAHSGSGKLISAWPMRMS